MRLPGTHPGGYGRRGRGSLEVGSPFEGTRATSMAGVGLAAFRYGTAGRSDEAGMKPPAERSRVQGRTVRAGVLDSGGCLARRTPAPAALVSPTAAGTPRSMAAPLIGFRRPRDRGTDGAWRRALACLLAFALIIALVDPAPASPRVGPDHGNGLGTASLFEPDATVSAADDRSDRGRPGSAQCTGCCPCHAAIRPNGGVAVPARVARALEFPLSGDGFRSRKAARPTSRHAPDRSAAASRGGAPGRRAPSRDPDVSALAWRERAARRRDGAAGRN